MKTSKIVAQVVIISALATMVFATTPSIFASSGKQTLALTQESSTSSPSVKNQTMNNMTTTAATPTTNTSSTNKTFYLFTIETEGVNETKLGISGDVYSLQTMVVNKGDEVTVHFYNLEKDAGEKHSFTIGAPYNINKVLAGGDNATITFKADHEGVFQYHCMFHPPEMIGQLIVLPAPITE